MAPEPFLGSADPQGPAPGFLAALSRSAMPLGAPKPLRSTGDEPDPRDQFYAALEAGDPEAEAELRRVFKEVQTQSLEGRELIERGWWQKLLYVNGRQWIYYTSRGGWMDKRLARWIPRPVTNICDETVNVIRAMLSAIEPSARVRPVGSDPMNVVAADKCDRMEPVLNEEHEMQTRWFEADWWTPTLGCSFLHPYWDRDDPTHTEFVQMMACGKCHALVHPLDLEEEVTPGCPQCGAPAEGFALAYDAQNEPVGKQETVGKGATRVLSPLEVLIPVYFQRWEDVDRLIVLSWRPKSYYDGRPYAKKIQYRSTPADRSLQMYRALALMTDLTTTPYQGAGATSSRVEGTIEAELWIKPNAEYPKGLWCRSVGGAHGEAFIIRDPERGVIPGPLPYEDTSGRKLWNWVYYPYGPVGGRLWPKSALDPVIPKQDQINRNDSMVELIMQRMANPIWLEPKGAEVQRFTGEPGLIVRYQVVAGTNAKPERLEGIGPNGAFFSLREQYFQDAERMTGTGDALKGIKPSGVEAFSALNLLVERSENRFTTLKKGRGRAYRQWFEIAIELERSYGPRSRTWAARGEGNGWLFETFQKKDLAGAITIVTEDGSDTPKTALGKRAALQQLQQMGFRFSEDPERAFAVFELIGLTEVAPGLAAQITAAQVEFEQYERWVAAGRLDPATKAPAVTPQGPPNPTTGVPQIGETPGNPLVCRPWQHHKVYLQQLDLWASTDRVRTLVAKDPAALHEITYARIQHVIAADNPFGLPTPPQPQPVPPERPKTSISIKGPDLANPLVQEVLNEEGLHVQPVIPAPLPPHPNAPPVTNGHQPGGAAVAMQNSNRESGATDTLPGAAPGGGNMAPPA